MYRHLILGLPAPKNGPPGLALVCEKYLKRATGGVGKHPADMKACELIIKISWELSGKGEAPLGGSEGRSLMDEAREAIDAERASSEPDASPNGAAAATADDHQPAG